jgi:hypothetical protein
MFLSGSTKTQNSAPELATPDLSWVVYDLKATPYTPAGFDLTTHIYAGRDDSTRPSRQGQHLFNLTL